MKFYSSIENAVKTLHYKHNADAIQQISFVDDGNYKIEGRLWAFEDYVMRDDLEELKNKGFVIYQLVEEDKE